MELYNSIIQDTLDLLSSYTPKELKIDSEVNWEMCKNNELILTKDAAFEMGGSRFPSTNYSCPTTSKELVGEDKILLYGEDLNNINEDIPFGRIVLLNIEDIDENTAHKSIKNLEYVKYDIIPKGYMIRASSFDRREQVRVSKEAIKKGINFEIIGNTYINKLKEDPIVNSVRIIFITENIAEFKELISYANKVDKITETLNHVLIDTNLDCQSCDSKPICDEIEGMRQLHFKSTKK